VPDNPQETVRELRDLVIAYTKQETVEPIKGLGRYLGFGLAGAVLIGFGIACVEIGILRLLQGWGPVDVENTFDKNWSWAPYAIVIAGSVLLAGLIWMFRVRRKRKKTA